MAMAMHMSYTMNELISFIGECMKSGIYRIYSIATNESYYGSSNNLKRRFNEHRFKWRNNRGNHKIRALLQKYGINNFKFEILENCLVDQFEEKEREYIQKDERNLNVWVLPFSSSGCNLGKSVKGKKFTGTPHTQETKEKQSRFIREYYSTHDGYWKGKSIPEEVRKKVSEGLKRYYSKNSNPNKGKSLSEETKRKISETLKKRNRGQL